MSVYIQRRLVLGGSLLVVLGGLTAGCQSDTPSRSAADRAEVTNATSEPRNNRSGRREATSRSNRRSRRAERTERTEPEPEASAEAVMPNVPCGTDLQDAQDLVQEAGVFYSTSEDATGQGRNQILDANWTVVGQRPPAGEPIGEGTAVFLVVKDEEFNGC